MRAFVRMWELLYSDKSLALKVEKIEQEMKTQGQSLHKVFTNSKSTVETTETDVEKNRL